jgi:hypothetical protein
LLDVYPNEQQATKFATEFIKQLKVKQWSWLLNM